MKLAKLLERMEYERITGSVEREISSLSYDSRNVGKGAAFVCICGMKADGHQYIPAVFERGAAAVIIEKIEALPEDMPQGITVILVKDTRLALAEMSAAYFGYPAERMTMIGITGTKGKTTTAYMIYSILTQAGIRTGLIGTVEIRFADKTIPAEHTTPESYELQRYLSKMAEDGISCVVMEVSSQGLKLNRVGGIFFNYGIFTNIEPDHIGEGEHPDFEDYLMCKSQLFSRCQTGILNADDLHFDQILQGHTCEVETFGLNQAADFTADAAKLRQEGARLGVSYRVHGRVDFDVYVDIPGSFSIYNSLAAIAVCSHFPVPDSQMKEALATVQVKGRVEVIPISDRFTLMIDYAHNAMSLKSLLTTLREYHPKRLVCLFGCGGNRSRDRRYEMGELSARLADLTVVTSDNPRFEEPDAIIADILTGVKRGGGEYIRIPDRKEAIRCCIRNSREGDVIVLAGKGHEDYQEIQGVKYPMDERVLIREIVKEMPEKERQEKRIGIADIG